MQLIILFGVIGMLQNFDKIPSVSVLMPVYNGEKFIKDAITSVLNQTFQDFEFIIINDGSTDRSEEIILSFNDPRIRYFKNNVNLKLISTLNKGLDLCRGKYIARMDCDDFAYPHRLETQFVFMESNTDHGLCGSDIDIDGDYKSWVAIGDMEFIKFCFLFLNPLSHPTAFLRTSTIKENKLYYPKEYIHAEEYIYWLNIMNYSKVANLPEKLLRYRFHSDQISTLFKNEQIQIGKRIKLLLFNKIVLISTEGMKKTHLIIAEIFTKAIEQSNHIRLDHTILENMSFNFGGWVSVNQLRLWIFSMKISLFFRKKWDSVYLRTLICKVEEGLKFKVKNSI
ncbi:MAG: glycosyltransferase family 2 protein [Bacteroidota bacterium]|jgi:glycosyltransferase involved in cell wall biosynthesis